MERACLETVVTGNVTVIDFASSATGWEPKGEKMPVCMQ